MSDRKEREIMHLVQERIPGVRIGMIQVEKNNGSMKKGFQFFPEGQSTGVVVYQEGVEAACGDCCTAEEAADYLCRAVERERDVRIYPEDISSWETAKYRVYQKVVNYEKNSSRLSAVLHRRYLDLAVVYYVRIPISGRDEGICEIPAGMRKEWGISEVELEEQVKRNMKKEGYHMESLHEFLFGGEVPGGSPDPGMYVLLGRRKDLGAGVMARPELMKELMERVGSDCYLLPSSIHELLVCPCGCGLTAAELKVMVQEVNREAVSEEEFLSDEVYYCHMDTGEVGLCHENGIPAA